MVKACFLTNPVHTKDPTSYDEVVVVCVEVRQSVTVSVMTILTPSQRFLTLGPEADMGPWMTKGSMNHHILPDIDTTIQVATSSNLHTHPLQ